MGYNLQTFICQQFDATALTKYYDQVISIDLEHGLCLIPMTGDLFDQINKDIPSANLNGFYYLTENIVSQVSSKIANIKFAYIEADYFGGKGTQNSIIWDKGQTQLLGSINEVLINFGIKASQGKNEFETLALGRYRDTTDWIETQ